MKSVKIKTESRPNGKKKPAPSVDAAGRTGRHIKILQLCAVDFTVYHFLLPLGIELSMDYEVHFASAPGPYSEKIQEKGFPFHPVPIKRSYDIISHAKSLAALKKLISRERYDIVHTHTPIAALIGRIASRLTRVPVTIYTAHGFYFHDRMPGWKRRIFISLEKLGSAFTDFTFTQSLEDCEAAVSLGIARSDRILHIGNGVDLERFNPEKLSERRKPVREAFGIGADQPLVCVIGRLVREKGYFELIEAFKTVVREVPGARLLVIGGALESDHDNAESEIRKRVKDCGLDDAVRFLSFRGDVEEILCASDIFVLPSHREGMPRSILEAMAMGLPVIATDIRGAREEVRDGISGLLVNVGDSESLAAALVSLLRDPERRARMGRRGREIAVERFDEKSVIKKQTDVIRRLLDEKGLS